MKRKSNHINDHVGKMESGERFYFFCDINDLSDQDRRSFVGATRHGQYNNYDILTLTVCGCGNHLGGKTNSGATIEFSLNDDRSSLAKLVRRIGQDGVFERRPAPSTRGRGEL